MIEGGTTARGHLLVRRLESHSPLLEKDRAALSDLKAELCRVSAGMDLVLEGEPPKGAFVVLEGFVCRYHLLPNGHRHITAYLLPGDFCDLDVLLLPRMDHSIGALSDCVVARLAPATVHDLLQRPAVARALRSATLAEMVYLREWLVNVGARQAVVRVAHLLCGLHARLQAVGLTVCDSFDFPLTQKDLADTMGLSDVHMNRSLMELRRADLIEMQRKRLTILDLPRLRGFAYFEPNCLIFDGREPLYLHLQGCLEASGRATSCNEQT